MPEPRAPRTAVTRGPSRDSRSWVNTLIARRSVDRWGSESSLRLWRPSGPRVAKSASAPSSRGRCSPQNRTSLGTGSDTDHARPHALDNRAHYQIIEQCRHSGLGMKDRILITCSASLTPNSLVTPFSSPTLFIKIRTAVLVGIRIVRKFHKVRLKEDL